MQRNFARIQRTSQHLRFSALTGLVPIEMTPAQIVSVMSPCSQIVQDMNETTRWCPSSLAKLVYKSNFTMVFVGDISIVNGIIIHLQLGGHPLVPIISAILPLY